MLGRKVDPVLRLTPSPSVDTSPRASSSNVSSWSMEDDVAATGNYTYSRPLTVTIPSGPFCPRRPTLAEILANRSPPPWTLTAFMAYLSQNHCLETLEFTMDASRYKKHYNKVLSQVQEMDIDQARRELEYIKMLWRRLVDAYIKPNGAREVNIPSDVRNRILAHQVDLEPPAPDILDPAVRKIYDLMDESVLVPFLNSVSCSQLRSPSSSWTDPAEEYMSGSLDERLLQQEQTRRNSAHLSPDYLGASYPAGSSYGSRTSTTSNLVHVQSDPSASGDSLTDDTGSGSSPGKEPMTPPNTPPGSDAGSLMSPRSRSEQTWKKMATKMGFKRRYAPRAGQGQCGNEGRLMS